MEIANVEAAEAWDGDEGEHWAEHAERYEHSSWRHRARLLQASSIRPDDHVIDIGCGSGTVDDRGGAARVRRVGARGRPVLADARRRRSAARGRRGRGATSRFVQGDAQVHPFEPSAADVAMSHFGAMFFGDPVAAFTNIAGGLRPGRAPRPAGLAGARAQRLDHGLPQGRSRSDASSRPRRPTRPTPFSLADPDRVRARLSAAGYRDVDLQPVDEPDGGRRSTRTMPSPSSARSASSTACSTTSTTRQRAEGLDEPPQPRSRRPRPPTASCSAAPPG